MKRIFHPYYKWEDHKNGFYGGMMYEKDDTLELYAGLLRELTQFEKALKHIIVHWPYSCEHNLTNESMNRIAYLGQASCALLYNVPSSVSMGGYNLLTKAEQMAADAMAEKYLNIWIKKHESVKKVS